MSEPIILYRDGEMMIVTAPSWAKVLQAQGWTTEPDADDVPFTLKDTYVDEDDFANITQEVDVVPVKRGRPRKAKA